MSTVNSRSAACSLMVLALALHSSPSQADILQSASFSALISGGYPSQNQVFRQSEAGAFTLNTGFVSFGTGGFDVTASFSGGPSPSASITGYGYPDIHLYGLNVAQAELRYSVRIYLEPEYSDAIFETPVPVSVSGLLQTSVETLPMAGRIGGFAAANVWITGPGINFALGSQSSFNSPRDPLTDSRRFEESVTLFAGGSSVDVRLLARGQGSRVAFSAYADPVFRIDPDATFDFNGETIRFVDAVGLEYSPGISAVPEPNALWLFASAIGLLAIRCRASIRKRNARQTS